MRLAPLLLLLAGTASCGKPRWDIGLDVVFPGNDTYKSGADYPVVFVFHNAFAAFTYGFGLSWQVTPSGDDAKVMSTGAINQEPQSDNAVNTTKNQWYPIDHMTNSSHFSPGAYNFTWTWIMRTCSIADSAIQVDETDHIASGFILFGVSGSGKDVDLTANCPIHGAHIYIDAAEPASEYMASCPYISDDNSTTTGADNCDGKLSSSSAACLMSNLTGKGDTSHCPVLVATNATVNDTSEGGQDNTTTNGTDHNGGGDNSAPGIDALASSRYGIWAAMGATFFAAFLL